MLLAGCRREAAPRADVKAVPGDHCAALLADYRAVLTAASGRCEVDADCVPYGGVDPDAVCGGATDVETGRALARIAHQRVEARCAAPGYSCAPIDAHCADRVCRP
jgi:hypothetical protein